MRAYPRTWAEINLAAVAHNIACVRHKMGTAKVEIALVAKADAYGHGLVPISRFACQHGVDWVAVATVQEGIALRDAGIEKPIMVLSPILPIECDQAVFYNLDVLIENIVMARHLDAAANKIGTVARVHLEVDTGIHRFGCDPREAAKLAREIAGQKNIHLVGIAQHFADSSTDPAFTQNQMEDFRKV
ncbi:MAG: alanine racemase, partial [Fimbriimonadaceae bacterium]|nr:alanine racemase [Fimbriimonadaceae bacterium]